MISKPNAFRNGGGVATMPVKMAKLIADLCEMSCRNEPPGQKSECIRRCVNEIGKTLARLAEDLGQQREPLEPAPEPVGRG